jgi:uncharacterized protein (DUF2267 family)
LGCPDDPHRAYQALRAVLHALRDRLSVDDAASLAAQLPMLVRGIFYEGWHPHGKPLKERKKEDFLAHIRADFVQDPDVDAEQVTRAVFQLLAKQVTAGEVEKLKRTLPPEIRALWPTESGTEAAKPAKRRKASATVRPAGRKVTTTDPNRVDVTGVMPDNIRVDPNITEGHPGYQESGDSEIIPTERLTGPEKSSPG